MARRSKEAVLTGIGIYPLLTVVLLILMPVLTPLPFLVQNLLVTLVLVPLMSFLVMPVLTRTFAGWLRTDKDLTTTTTSSPKTVR